MDDAFALLRLQVEWGADEAIGPDPTNRLRAVETRPVPVSHPTSIVAAPTGTPAERALGVANQAATLQDLYAAIAAFDGCALRDTASNPVFAEGNPASAILIVGEPPGRDEDRSGHPFAGPEGALLDQMLASINLNRTELMLAPLLPWRPPGGRPPSEPEIATCLPFLHRLIALLKPDRMVLFGGTAARTLLPPTHNRRRSVPGWLETNIPGTHKALPVLTIPGLADMLKNPMLRRDAWARLRLLRRTMGSA